MIRLLHLRNPCTILLLDLNIRGTVGLWKAWVILVTIHPHPFKPIIQSDTSQNGQEGSWQEKEEFILGFLKRLL
jgi:hypothetical protein